MKALQVTYTTSEAFSAQNQSNIKRVMDDLQNAHHRGIHYHACMLANNKTFIHTAFFASDEDQKTLNEMPSFKSFQQQLKASEPEVAPRQEVLTFIGSSSIIF